MISFQLRCSTGHEFEAWFKNGAAYDEQQSDGIVSCPMCGDMEVCKALMAPAVATKGNNRSPAYEKRANEVAKEILETIDKVRTHVEDNCEYVGDEFAEEARKIHFGETDDRGIYGEASIDEAAELEDEGVEFFRLPPNSRRNN